LPTPVRALELRKDPRLELLVDATLSIFFLSFSVTPFGALQFFDRTISRRNPGRRFRAVREFHRFIKRAD